MKHTKAEFDTFADNYDALLDDPIRNLCSRGGNQFFHIRKRDMIRDYCERRSIEIARLSALDIGCGRGELLKLLRKECVAVAGCDPSREMLEKGRIVEEGIEVRVQSSGVTIPFEDERFDLVTAACVFHHVVPEDRDALMAEVRRVLKPGGVFALIEHNPYNPMTRLIVRRTPVDRDAILLTARSGRGLLRRAGFLEIECQYFLILPASIYNTSPGLERFVGRLPLGGQYALFCTAPDR